MNAKMSKKGAMMMSTQNRNLMYQILYFNVVDDVSSNTVYQQDSSCINWLKLDPLVQLN